MPFPHKYILDVRQSRVVLCYKRQYFLFCAFVFVFKGPFSIFEVNFEKVFSKNSFGYPLFFRRVLKLCMFLLNVECDEFVLRRRSVSPFMNPLFTPGG